MTTNSKQPPYPVCPICTGFIPDDITPGAYPGALSRVDNETRICSDCGRAEAMRSVGRLFSRRQTGKSEHALLTDRDCSEHPNCPLCLGPMQDSFTSDGRTEFYSRVNNTTEICEECAQFEDMLVIAYVERELLRMEPPTEGD